ncbi:hypothetical protein TNCV_4794371 [Trichonephila clavipes]|nr:hypothetical protein TNCV_4794371 [Trichonephila clavipes]
MSRTIGSVTGGREAYSLTAFCSLELLSSSNLSNQVTYGVVWICDSVVDGSLQKSLRGLNGQGNTSMRWAKSCSFLQCKCVGTAFSGAPGRET